MNKQATLRPGIKATRILTELIQDNCTTAEIKQIGELLQRFATHAGARKKTEEIQNAETKRDRL